MSGKLPKYPDFLLATPVSIYIEDGINEDGSPNVREVYSGKCRFSDKSGVSYADGKKQITLYGSIQCAGDIAPDIADLKGASVSINGGEYKAVKFMRPRNPDGSVHHTTLELK